LTPLPPRRCAARTEALWTIGVFVVASVVALGVIETRCPQWCDREYEVRREVLNERIAESPDRPVMLLIGSSRTVVAFMPERLPPLRTPDSKEAIVFNYSHFGSGPKMNMLQVHRALRDGVHPHWVVLELVPGFLAHDDLPYKDMSIEDIPVIYQYSNGPRLIAQSARVRLGGVYRTRTAMSRWALPEFVTKSPADREVKLHELGGDNGFGRLDDLTDSDRAGLTMLAVGRFKKRMMEYKIDPLNAKTMNDLVEFCQSQGIQVGVVMTPEDSRYYSWQRPGADEVIAEYADELRAKFHIPVIDARRWMADSSFSDPHHLNTKGAKQFTDRLDRELLRGMVEGK
jgi:Protein of unknown function (DUF1574)